MYLVGVDFGSDMSELRKMCDASRRESVGWPFAVKVILLLLFTACRSARRGSSDVMARGYEEL